MKKTVFLSLIIVLVTQTSCFLDGKKSDNSKNLLLFLIKPVTGITLDKTSATIINGGTERLAATIVPSDATNKNFTWSSSDASKAVVSSGGIVTGTGIGPATITATTADGGLTASCAVTVTALTIKSTAYYDNGSVNYHYEMVYPSINSYLQNLKEDINCMLFPTFSDRLFRLGASPSNKLSSAIGSDGVWFTADDTFAQYYEIIQVSNTVSRCVYYSNFSGTISNYYEYGYDSAGRVIARMYYNGAGADGTWFTGDDVKAKDSDGVAVLSASWSDNDNGTAVGYDVDGTTVTRQYEVKRDFTAGTITYRAFQGNGTTPVSANVFDYTGNRTVFYSSSMTVTQYFGYTLNAKNVSDTMGIYVGSGSDGIWFTSDDVTSAYSVDEYDVDGFSISGTIYSSPAKTTRLMYYVTTH